jgi:endonuclease/exonuclease/phosphatase family metal-dependent hydrolase
MGESISKIAALPHAAVAADTLSVVTWNVWFDSLERERRIRHILCTMQSMQPDVACFQEVTAHFIAVLRHNSALNAEYDVFEDVSPAFGVSAKSYGALIMCKKTYAATFSRHNLTSLMERDLLVAELQLGKGQRACVATVHLESMDSHNVRVQQMKEIKDVFSSKSSALLAQSPSTVCSACDPVVFCGDFNFCSDSNWGVPPSEASPLYNNDLSAIFPDFVDVWPQLHATDGLKGYTWDCCSNLMLKDKGNKDPLCRLDRVLMRSDGRWRASSVDMLGTSSIHTLQLPGDAGSAGASVSVFPSDHFGLHAVFKLDGRC